MVSEPGKALEIFFSYSHKDQDLRDQLDVHLSLLKHQGFISNWYDRKIIAGTEWDGEIDTHLNRAQIILVLVSADFLASNYCYDIEVKRAMERHNAGEARVIPIILRPCDWHTAPFGKLLPLPIDGKPVTGRSWRSRDEAFLNVTQGIRKVSEQLLEQALAKENSSSTASKPPRNASNVSWQSKPFRVPESTLSTKHPSNKSSSVTEQTFTSPTATSGTNTSTLSQHQLSTPGSSILLWIGIVVLLITVILGIYAIVSNQNALFSGISFLLTLLAIIIAILQAAPNILSHVKRTIKMGLLIIGILLLIVSLTMNGYLLIHILTSTNPNTPLQLPTLVQKNFFIQSQNTTSNTVKFPSRVTTGDLIVVAITHFQGPISSVTDNQNDIYIQVTVAQHANSSTDYAQLFYAKNVTGGATTVTSREGGNIGIYEYSGLDPISPLDQVTSNVGSDDTPDGGSLNTTKDNELYFVVGADDNGGNAAISVGSGYTLENYEEDSIHHERFYTESRVAIHGSYQTNFSIAAASHWAVIGASFKPVGTQSQSIARVLLVRELYSQEYIDIVNSA